MLPFGVTIPATVPQRSEIPEGLKNYPVYVAAKGALRILVETLCLLSLFVSVEACHNFMHYIFSTVQSALLYIICHI